jgi:hypothetical protein
MLACLLYVFVSWLCCRCVICDTYKFFMFACRFCGRLKSSPPLLLSLSFHSHHSHSFPHSHHPAVTKASQPIHGFSLSPFLLAERLRNQSKQIKPSHTHTRQLRTPAIVAVYRIDSAIMTKAKPINTFTLKILLAKYILVTYTSSVRRTLDIERTSDHDHS